MELKILHHCVPRVMYTIIINKLELKRKVREDKIACELVKSITWGYGDMIKETWVRGRKILQGE